MTAEYRSFLRIVQQRRSIRCFRPQPVPHECVDMLMEAARWAPSAGNQQGFRFVAVTRSEVLSALADAVRQEIWRIQALVRDDYRDQAMRYSENFLFFSRAPLLIVPIHRHGTNLLNIFCDQEVVSEKDAIANVYCSVSAAIMNLLLAAQTLGLGACWMTGPLIARAAMERLLDVPAGWAISALIPVGYPDESPPAPKRRSIAQILRHLE